MAPNMYALLYSTVLQLSSNPAATPNPAVDPVRFALWTLRDEAAQRRSPPLVGRQGIAMPLIEELKRRARQLKAETFALYLAARHPDTPWYAKLLVAAIVAYAFSPIDLIPDFIPIVGYLDDLVLIPIGIAFAIKLVPPNVLAECRARAQEVMVNGKPASRVAGAVVVIIWLALAALCIVWAYEAFMPMSATPNPAVHMGAAR